MPQLKKITVPSPVSLELFPPQTFPQSDRRTEIRLCQGAQFGKHFVEVRYWKLENENWQPTSDYVRVSIDEVIRVVEEINATIKLLEEKANWFYELRAKYGTDCGKLKEVNTTMAIITKQQKRIHEIRATFSSKVMPGAQLRLRTEIQKFLAKERRF